MSENLTQRHARHAEYCRDRLAQEAALERAFDMHPGDAVDWRPEDKHSGSVCEIAQTRRSAITDTPEGCLDHATGVLTPWPKREPAKSSFNVAEFLRREVEVRRARAQAWRF